MLSTPTKIYAAFALIISAIVMMVSTEYHLWMSALLIASAIGMVHNRYVTPEDLLKIFSWDGIISISTPIVLVLFGLRIIAIYIDFLLQYLSWLQIGWMLPAGALLFGAAALTSKKKNKKK